eukprot:SAG11_NODE_55_length_19449_cov_28.630135_10_plen_135_part_00
MHIGDCVFCPSPSSMPVGRKKQHYHTYDEMTELMRSWAASSPLCDLSSIGTTQEGRELWLMTMTDSSTGPADGKPAFWCEANTHAGEVTGTEATVSYTDVQAYRPYKIRPSPDLTCLPFPDPVLNLIQITHTST